MIVETFGHENYCSSLITNKVRIYNIQSKIFNVVTSNRDRDTVFVEARSKNVWPNCFLQKHDNYHFTSAARYFTSF